MYARTGREVERKGEVHGAEFSGEERSTPASHFGAVKLTKAGGCKHMLRDGEAEPKRRCSGRWWVGVAGTCVSGERARAVAEESRLVVAL
jgi:hypothetical protein